MSLRRQRHSETDAEMQTGAFRARLFQYHMDGSHGKGDSTETWSRQPESRQTECRQSPDRQGPSRQGPDNEIGSSQCVVHGGGSCSAPGMRRDRSPALRSREAECDICYEAVIGTSLDPHDAVWKCARCTCLLHARCQFTRQCPQCRNDRQAIAHWLAKPTPVVANGWMCQWCMRPITPGGMAVQCPNFKKYCVALYHDTSACCPSEQYQVFCSACDITMSVAIDIRRTLQM